VIPAGASSSTTHSDEELLAAGATFVIDGPGALTLPGR
jgi:hypothetical protein